MNRASGTFRDGSNRANSGGSNLLEILIGFQDVGVLEGLEMVILVDFNWFCNVWATQTNRAAELHLCTTHLRLVLLCFWMCFFMFLVLGEQNCNSHGGFKAKVYSEDATCRGSTLWRISRCAQTLKKTLEKSIIWLPGGASREQMWAETISLKSLSDCQNPQTCDFPDCAGSNANRALTWIQKT